MKKFKFNGIFYVVISLLLVGGVAGAYSLSQNVNVSGDYNYYEAEGQDVPEDVNLGGASGPHHYFMNNFYDGAMVGGATSTITATTTSGDLLLTSSQICDNSWLTLDSSIQAGAFTLTLPTATELWSDCYRGSGMEKTGSFYVDNQSGNDVTVTAGTGGELLEGDGLNVVIGTGNWAKLEVVMDDNGDQYILTSTELQDGD